MLPFLVTPMPTPGIASRFAASTSATLGSSTVVPGLE